MEPLICRALTNGKFESRDSVGTLLTESFLIENAKKYGVMKPRNGKYFTFKAINKDREITDRTIIVGMTLAFMIASVKLKTRYIRVGKDEPADFTVEFVSTEEDDIMTANTLMYHYYPIQDLNDPNRGVCRVNTDHFWTGNGHGIDMHHIDPIHYPTLNPRNPLGKTYDFDQVYRHEAVGHGHGLPHIPEPNHMMSPNEGIMSEYPSEVEWAILGNKYGLRSWPSGIWSRFFNNYKVWSEKYQNG